MKSCACSNNQDEAESPMGCCSSLPGPTYMSRNVAHIDPLTYNRNFVRSPSGGNYLKVPKANSLGISTPFSNRVRDESGFCCSRLSNDCACSPIIQYEPGENLPDVYTGYDPSCPCYPIDLPGPNYGSLNYVPWTVPYVDMTTKKVTNVTNPNLVNIAPP